MKRFVMVLGLILFLVGIVALVHPNFDYHKREEVAKVGRVTATFDRPERATIPPIAAAALLIAGAGLIALAPRLK
jgi:hypothetical protein